MGERERRSEGEDKENYQLIKLRVLSLALGSPDRQALEIDLF